MTLGPRQLERLARVIELGKSDHVRLEVWIYPYQRSRESGTGYPVFIKPYEFYTDTGEYEEFPMRSYVMSFCSQDYTAIDKAKELANYLVDNGVPKDLIKIKRLRQWRKKS